MTLNNAKEKLDTVIQKSRVHMYKPIQIAEILYEHRVEGSFSLSELEDYRRQSKAWRDTVSQKLIGRVCTSSAKFQDNIFENNAVNPANIVLLGEENERLDRAGIVEAYIYQKIKEKISPLSELETYLDNATPDSFELSEFIDMFRREPGLRRSVDKVYEIIVFALFDTITRHLNANVSLSIPENKMELLKDFEDFTRIVLGVDTEHPIITKPARLYRVGVTNASDRGLDMWANFGPIVQIKHISLTIEVAEDIIEGIASDYIVIVCQRAEAQTIRAVLNQVGFENRISGIITQEDLERWYDICFNDNHANSLGNDILQALLREFHNEFPSTSTVLDEFLSEREYDAVEFVGIWNS